MVDYVELVIYVAMGFLIGHVWGQPIIKGIKHIIGIVCRKGGIT